MEPRRWQKESKREHDPRPSIAGGSLAEGRAPDGYAQCLWVHTSQVTMSNRTKLQNKEHVIEALYRAKFKFPGRQKIHISKKWGFTKFNGDEFENMVAEK
ncbi:60S ribosomal protein L10 [Camelus dromedarius]|uniref:60S ribosomal protein L10 n=1 Tax=Camelus dromedarius TaxID=9838 RepID=A0A5N4C3A1_CAMDR|nr:60S ribosomal protein L10 [Camelus dromedarius]